MSFIGAAIPNPSELVRIFRALGANFLPKAALRDEMGMEPDVFETAVEKLLVHGGARHDGEGNISRGGNGWRPPYEQQSAHKLREPQQMLEFADKATGCRMVRLVRRLATVTTISRVEFVMSVRRKRRLRGKCAD